LNILNPAYARKTIIISQKIQEEKIELLDVVSNEVGDEDGDEATEEKIDVDEVVGGGGGDGVDSNIFIFYVYFSLFYLFYSLL